MQTIIENPSLKAALLELAGMDPKAPFLALGQTVFWDEPMKGGIVLASRDLGLERTFVAGVHDTDYFAKVPGAKAEPGAFKMLPHNDTTTKGLWSAAGEFSSLFGSETVVTREALTQAGLRIETLLREEPRILDQATEAWGWRGLCSLDEHAPITADVKTVHLFEKLKEAYSWALGLSVDCIGDQGRQAARTLVNQLLADYCDAGEDAPSASAFYRALLPHLYSLSAGEDVSVETAQTSEILRFNRETWSLPRFELLGLFLNPETRPQAIDAYNQCVQRSGLYDTTRFGTGAIPFDLVIPGKGRGTIRIGTRGIVIQTQQPEFLSIPSGQTIRDASDLARLVEAKFGPNCALVGKAVTLIGMLAREFVFVFHEGASSYVKISRELHSKLVPLGFSKEIHPILRVRYDAWSALEGVDASLTLPEPFRGPFGTTEIDAATFAARWKEVCLAQDRLLERLGGLHRPSELIAYLKEMLGREWVVASEEYAKLNCALQGLRATIEGLRGERGELLMSLRVATEARVAAEKEKGDHFRAKIFEKSPTSEDLEERRRLTERVTDLIHQISRTENAIHASIRKQRDLVESPEVRRQHAERRRIERAAELQRLQLIREAYTTSKGLARANFRPSAWWFPLVSPDGSWFRKTWETAECYLEPLI